jgi:hypothetical protein
MKLKTTYAVTVSVEEATKLLTRFVEKKSSKKVVSVSGDAEKGFTFTLQDEEADLDAVTKEPAA